MFGKIWAKVAKDRHVWMGQTDHAGMGDIGSGWVWVCVQVWGWVLVGVGKFGHI